MGRKRREHTYDNWKKAMDMLREGYKPLEISRKLDIPRQTVESWKMVLYHQQRNGKLSHV